MGCFLYACFWPFSSFLLNILRRSPPAYFEKKMLITWVCNWKFDRFVFLFSSLQPSYLEKYPSFYHSPQCERLKSFIRSRLFEYIVVFVLLVNLIAVVIETTVWHCNIISFFSTFYICLNFVMNGHSFLMFTWLHKMIIWTINMIVIYNLHAFDFLEVKCIES